MWLTSRPSRSALLGRRSRLARQDRGELVDVDLFEDALAPRLLQTRDELGLEEVDPPVQDAPAIRDLALLLRQVVDHLLELIVRHVVELGERFQEGAFRRLGRKTLVSSVKQRPPKGSTFTSAS